MTKSPERLICLGAFAGAHGVKGEAKVKSFTGLPRDVARYGVLASEDGKRRFRLDVIRILKGDIVLVRSPDIANREEAQALAGTRLYAPRAMLPEPRDADEFYIEDLVGLNAVDPAGAMLGRVVAIHNFGAGDIVEVKGDGSARMIPFTLAAVPDVDLQAGRIVVAATNAEPPLSDATGEIVSTDPDTTLSAMREEDA